ncbi:MAG: aminotransferase class I/II-fold pyridoxal phosphate-dependent enzyme [Nitrososphaeraceae archaeon]
MNNHKNLENDLDNLRIEMRNITGEIIKLINKRMLTSKKIGEIKNVLQIEVEDEKVENEIKDYVTTLTNDINMDTELAGKILNVLLIESVKLQINKTKPKQTHMGVFLKAKDLESQGKKIIHLEVGEPDFEAPAQVQSELSSIYNRKKYHYTQIVGIPELRDLISKKINRNDLTKENVLITPGGRFGIFSAITSLLSQGDELINIEPSWPAYRDCGNFIGVKTRTLKTNIEENWNPDLVKLEQLINQNTKMIVLNYPNNPTGKILDYDTLNNIVLLARKHNLFILSDEVYSAFSFKKFTSILNFNYKKSIMVSSFSKTYGMTGFRVGYVVASKDIINKVKNVQTTAITSVAEPMQYCALSALDADPIKNVNLIKSRLDVVCERLKKLNLSFFVPDGAMYVYPKINSDISDLDLVDRLLEQGVAISPGSGFGSSYSQFIRISVCRPISEIQKGLDVLEKNI